MIHKACAIVLRRDASELLAFHHPQAGAQLVKGTVEPMEEPARAALRELYEESGVSGMRCHHLFSDTQVQPGQIWHIYHVETAQLPDHWQHYCLDDSGHVFRFFWHRRDACPDAFHVSFQRVIRGISQHL